jgi:chromosomal replication initiator protein
LDKDRSVGDAETWASILEALRGTVNPQQFQTWFRSMRPVSLQKGLYVFSVPNTFLKDWIDTYYLDLLGECVASALGASQAPDGRPAEIRIVVAGAQDADEKTRNETTEQRGATARPVDVPTESAPRTEVAQGGPGRVNGAPPAAPEPPRRETVPVAGRRRGRVPHPLDEIRGQLFGHAKYRHFLSDVILNEDYVFDHFVRGPSNQLAHAAATAVADAPAMAYNPLFLHGPVGVGKTHLLQAICQRVLAKRPESRILYLSCETFVNQFISSVEAGDLEDFRYRYRHVDMLLIDDIHFLAKKERTQEEFFHTFNTLYNSKKQIVLSCDSPPREIPTLEDRLVSRFKWGLVTQIEEPGQETRVSIVRRKAERKGVTLPDGVADLVADNIATNVRELEGAVLRVIGYAALTGKKLTMELAQEALRDVIQPKERKVTIETILRTVADHYGVKASEITGKRRHKSISLPRQVCMYLARRLTDYSLVEIGGQFGGRDHTTVLYANEKIARLLQTNQRLKEDLDVIMRRIRSGE